MQAHAAGTHLSGSDGAHISWDMRDGPFICDLLTASIVSGKWSLKADGALQQVIVQLNVWDFARKEYDNEWIGEPPQGFLTIAPTKRRAIMIMIKLMQT